MNKTKIDWCDQTWNPVTGCLHNCDYCYARKIANRFSTTESNCYNVPETISEKMTEHGLIVELSEYLDGEPYPYGFVPVFHKYRLRQPQNTKKSQNIFVCSMADLFGEWVPGEWIEAVFEAAGKAPQHNYLFLTKNPQRYNDLLGDGVLPIKSNYWYGVTRDGSGDERQHEFPFLGKSFLSIEPILAPVEFPFDCTDWVIVGAETGNRKGKVIPKKEWIMNIAEQCQAAGTPIFMKESLRQLMGKDFIQEWPEGLRR